MQNLRKSVLGAILGLALAVGFGIGATQLHASITNDAKTVEAAQVCPVKAADACPTKSADACPTDDAAKSSASACPTSKSTNI